jgi:hypothetical protein
MNGHGRFGQGRCCSAQELNPRGVGQGGHPWGGGFGHCCGGAWQEPAAERSVRYSGAQARRGALDELLESLQRRIQTLEERLAQGSSSTP